MVGSVGMVRGVSRPGSLVIQEALNLLSALGSDGKGTTKKLLMEMKGVQDHNQAGREIRIRGLSSLDTSFVLYGSKHASISFIELYLAFIQ